MSENKRAYDKITTDIYSDYGSDLSSGEEQIIERVIADITDTKGSKAKFHTHNNYENDQKNSHSKIYSTVTVGKISDTFCYAIEDGERALSKNFRESSSPDTSESSSTLHRSSKKKDIRSPLCRFRSRPRKGLTVTDLVTPAWCEMKYWYVLSKHGVQKETVAMKQGTRIHEKLESEIHTFVPIKLHIKEDKLGLRIWNVIQGLRTLRECGRTRELQVWGTVDGQLVGGKIDELSYQCADMNNNGLIETSKPDEIKSSTNKTPDVISIIDEDTSLKDLNKNCQSQNQKIYICDVKTRSVQRLPTEISFKPTKYQLMLYHRFISNLITGKLDIQILTNHYKLDPERTFSDLFLTQVCSLEESPLRSKSEEESISALVNYLPHIPEPLPMILANYNLSSLWHFMLSEFQKTFPDGVTSLSDILKAEFRSSNLGNIIGTKTFLMNDVDLTNYLNYTMEWWKGERAPLGVPANEAYKCKSCSFAEICEWRLKKVEEDRSNFILKREALNLKSAIN